MAPLTLERRRFPPFGLQKENWYAWGALVGKAELVKDLEAHTPQQLNDFFGRYCQSEPQPDHSGIRFEDVFEACAYLKDEGIKLLELSAKMNATATSSTSIHLVWPTMANKRSLWRPSRAMVLGSSLTAIELVFVTYLMWKVIEDGPLGQKIRHCSRKLREQVRGRFRRREHKEQVRQTRLLNDLEKGKTDEEKAAEKAAEEKVRQEKVAEKVRQENAAVESWRQKELRTKLEQSNNDPSSSSAISILQTSSECQESRDRKTGENNQEKEPGDGMDEHKDEDQDDDDEDHEDDDKDDDKDDDEDDDEAKVEAQLQTEKEKGNEDEEGWGGICDDE